MSATTQGQRRYQQEQRREALQRVRAFKRWVAAGCPSGPNVPALPSSHDFKIATGGRR
jgi:hypothetical protein